MKQLRTGRALALQALISGGILAAAMPASALHRCTTPEGKVTYTEFPCETGSKASGVEIHDSSGMEVNKRTNNFSYTPRPSAPSRSSSPRSSQPTQRRTGTGGQTVGDVYQDKGEYKSKSGGTIDRPPAYRVLEPGADKEREQRRLDREWDDYGKQQRELKQKYRDQPLK